MDELIRLAPLAVWIVVATFLSTTRHGFAGTPAEKFGIRFRQVLSFVFWPLALVSAANFSGRQAIVLGFMLAWLAYQNGKALKASPHRFTPYVVEVRPDWARILQDFKLVSSLEEWHSIRESVKHSPYSVLRDGVKFTVVQQGGGEATALPKRARENHIGWQEVRDFDGAMNQDHPPLIFWSQHQTFGATFNFYKEMTPICFQEPDVTEPSRAVFSMRLHCTYADNPRGRKYRAGVLGGFDLRIEVPLRWWERVKDSCPAPQRIDSDLDSPFVSLILATLPLSEFYSYRNPEDPFSYEYLKVTEPYLRKRRTENRENFGWTGKDTATLYHTYFAVEHRAI